MLSVPRRASIAVNSSGHVTTPRERNLKTTKTEKGDNNLLLHVKAFLFEFISTDYQLELENGQLGECLMS